MDPKYPEVGTKRIQLHLPLVEVMFVPEIAAVDPSVQWWNRTSCNSVRVRMDPKYMWTWCLVLLILTVPFQEGKESGIGGRVFKLTPVYPIGERGIPTLGLWRWLNTWHLALDRRDQMKWTAVYSSYILTAWGKRTPCGATQGIHLGTKWTTRAVRGRLCSSKGGVLLGSCGRIWLACLNNSATRRWAGIVPDALNKEGVWLGDVIHGNWVGKGTWVRPFETYFIKCQGTTLY